MLPNEGCDFAITGKENFQHFLLLRWIYTGRNKERMNKERKESRKEREEGKEEGRKRGRMKVKKVICNA